MNVYTQIMNKFPTVFTRDHPEIEPFCVAAFFARHKRLYNPLQLSTSNFHLLPPPPLTSLHILPPENTTANGI